MRRGERTPLARQLRRAMTPSEQRLWDALRSRQLRGHKFRRQRPIEGFIADLCCDALRLIVEVDGGVHRMREQLEQDLTRESILRDQGFTVLRVTADEVMRDLDAVLGKIGEMIEAIESERKSSPQRPPHPPTPQRSSPQRPPHPPTPQRSSPQRPPHPPTPSPARGEGESRNPVPPLPLRERGSGGEGEKRERGLGMRGKKRE
ncbi:endonuclease domain-containing protein [Candidatus Sumerlaeota bacterium]|nr:endonuclease domain-containing protein [Candidatus Sumerlaeota bacterium]